MYQPLRQQLEKALGMPVEIVTASDFTEFAKRLVSQEYDIAVTTGHQARLAQTDAGYIPLITYSAEGSTRKICAFELQDQNLTPNPREKLLAFTFCEVAPNCTWLYCSASNEPCKKNDLFNR